jgi:phosphatidate cytidylyltransferase
MTGRSRRGVKFPHKHSSSNGPSSADGRRSSFSDVSEEGSPTKSRSGVRLDNIAEVRTPKPLRSPRLAPGSSVLIRGGLTQKPPAVEDQRSEYEKKKANFITRTFWSFVMIGGFFTALFMGHVYIILIITAIQIISFKEVIAIANVPSRARDLSSSKSLNYFWLSTTMYFLYGESVIYYFKHVVLVDKVLLPLATHHRFISFMLYVFGQSRL